MKIDPNKFYLVIKPHPKSEDFEEVFVDAKRNLADLRDLFGVYKDEDIYGIYSNRDEALQDAKKLWYNHAIGRESAVDDHEKRFNAFVDDLEAASAKHNIAIRSTGGVLIFDEPTTIAYSRDHTSGDLWPQWEEQE